MSQSLRLHEILLNLYRLEATPITTTHTMTWLASEINTQSNMENLPLFKKQCVGNGNVTHQQCNIGGPADRSNIGILGKKSLSRNVTFIGVVLKSIATGFLTKSSM